MKYKDPITGEIKDIYVKALDNLPVGSIVEFDGSTIPDGYEEVEEEEVVLYNNPSGGHGTLNLIRECDSSIKRVKIYAMDLDGYQKSTEILLDVSNKFELTFNYFNSKQAVHKYSRLHIDNTQIVEEVQGTTYVGSGTYSWDSTNSNGIKITKVIGYKEV